MTISSNNSGAINNTGADVYADFAGLTALKKSVRTNDPEALRQVARQYESLFTRIMIKSMRDAVGKDPLFGSDQEQSYQDMYDDQLSMELTKGKGLGLADLLVRQMQRLTGGGKTDPGATEKAVGAQDSSAKPDADGGQHSNSARLNSTTRATMGNTGLMPPGARRAALRLFQDTGSPGGKTANAVPASPETQDNFISELWPTAQAAGQQLGVDPRNLIAQAALETNWGTRVPHDSSGRSSNNLFGMKASGQWSGTSVSAATQEYQSGMAVSTTGQFRAYDSRAQSFQDYVSMLRGTPRYASALNTGSDTQAFASALQHGGYATDPDYARKIIAIAGSIHPRDDSPARRPPDPSLKSASARPINPSVETL
jgi:flagellar protein FlgJ